MPRPGIATNVHPAQARDSLAALRFHNYGVSGRVLLNDGQLDLRPDANFVVLYGHNKTLPECSNVVRIRFDAR